MCNYESYQLGELGKIVTGRTPKTENPENFGGDYMFICPADLHKHFFISDSERMISAQGLESIKGSALDGISILVGCIGWDMGNVGIVKGKCATNQQINSITNIQEKHNPLYIYYWLKTKKDFLFQQANVTRTPILNKTDFSSIRIYLPRKREYQDQVVGLLSTIDKKIELNNRINAELEAMTKTLYDHWFVQFDFPDANGKPYKTSGGKVVYNSTLKREIPEGWCNGTIVDVIGRVPQATKVLAKEFQENGKIPVIDQSQSYICGFTNDETASIKPESAHVIFGDHTRVVKLVNFEYARGADGTQVLVAKSDKVPSYLLYQIVSDIDLSSYGYARHYKFLKESKCVIPMAEISQRFQNTVKPWHEKIRENIFQNYELERLRDWLLPMLMNGQVTVI